jgi:hypothetical protein
MDPTPSSENPTEPVAVAAPVTPTPAVTVPAVEAAPAAVTPVVADKPVEVVPPVVAAPPAAVTPPPVAAPDPVYDLSVGKDKVSPALIAALAPIFKEAGVTAKQAQGMADAFAAHQAAVLPQMMQRDLDLIRADPQLGQLNFARTQARVNDALAAFSTPQERQALTALGIANNPTLVRMFHRIGASMQEPPQTDAGPQARAPKSPASKMYGGKDLVTSAGRSN